MTLGASVHHKETHQSAFSYHMTGEQIKISVFADVLVCNNNICEGLAAISGDFRIDTDCDNQTLYSETEYEYSVSYFSPSPHFIILNESLPDEIKKLCQSAFDLYWVDIHSCANKIRTAVEMCLLQKSVPQEKNLHCWIGNIETQHFASADRIKNYAFALKLVGNSGSHIDDKNLDHEDLLLSMELLEEIINQGFSNSDEYLNSAANTLNQKHNNSKLES